MLKIKTLAMIISLASQPNNEYTFTLGEFEVLSNHIETITAQDKFIKDLNTNLAFDSFVRWGEENQN